jgi:uncharacterized LabA/DUF88 family protein
VARLAIFIDGAYLDSLCRFEFNGAAIDLQRLPREIQSLISGDTQEAIDLLRTFYYTCPPYQSATPTAEESDRYAAFRRFDARLRSFPRFEVRLGRLQFQGTADDGHPIFQQKRVDLLLGLDIALLSGKQQITHVALVAGDSDFIPAIDVVKQEGVSVWLFHGPGKGSRGKASYSRELWQQADERREIDAAFVAKLARSSTTVTVAPAEPRSTELGKVPVGPSADGLLPE